MVELLQFFHYSKARIASIAGNPSKLSVQPITKSSPDFGCAKQRAFQTVELGPQFLDGEIAPDV